ncbi:MAG: pitrilysin family protein [Candidatus Jorgensenbacteria bacterium]
MQPFQKLILKNGLRVILVPEPQSLATTVLVSVETGSEYEAKEINGISHFLEHMCFKGTTNRPRHIDIANELDGLGAEYNAFTSEESTSYYAKVRNDDFEKALDVVADLYLNPTFDAGEIEKERGVIVGEINMYEDLPQRRVQEFFMELVYGDQPAGRSIAGTKDIVQKLQRDDFLKYRGAHYLASATVVTIAGGFSAKGGSAFGGDVEYATKLAERYFNSLGVGEKGVKPKTVEVQNVPRELVRFKEVDQTHMVMGFRAFDIHDERRFMLILLTDILGGGMGSRLFQVVREELGAAYYVRASADLYSDHGLVAMSAGVHHEKLPEVITVSLKEFARFKEELVAPADLARAKEHVTGGLFLSLETSDALAGFYAGQELMKVPLLSPQEIASKLQAVTAEDIRAVAREFFTNDRLNLALIGPFKNRSFLDILKP